MNCCLEKERHGDETRGAETLRRKGKENDIPWATTIAQFLIKPEAPFERQGLTVEAVLHLV